MITLLQNIQFQEAFWLWFIPFACLLVIWIFHFHPNNNEHNLDYPVKRQQAIWFPQLASVLEQGPPAKAKGRHFKWLNSIILCGVLACFFSTLAAPYLAGEKHAIKTRKRNIVLVVDTSIAMILKDYTLKGRKVDRMAFVRSILAKIIKAFEGDKISIIVYSNDAHIFVPLTDDSQLLLQQTQRIKTELSGRTNEMAKGLGLALSLSVNKNRTALSPNAGLQKSSQSHYKPVVILFSHGARPVGDLHPLQLLPLYQELGQKLYTVGIGADQQVQLNPAPGLVFDPVNVTLLSHLAKKSGGRFYRASSVDKVDPMIQSIRLNESAQEDIRFRTIKYSLFIWPLLSGVILLFAWQLGRLLNRGLYRGSRS